MPVPFAGLSCSTTPASHSPHTVAPAQGADSGAWRSGSPLVEVRVLEGIIEVPEGTTLTSSELGPHMITGFGISNCLPRPARPHPPAAASAHCIPVVDVGWEGSEGPLGSDAACQDSGGSHPQSSGLDRLTVTQLVKSSGGAVAASLMGPPGARGWTALGPALGGGWGEPGAGCGEGAEANFWPGLCATGRVREAATAAQACQVLVSSSVSPPPGRLLSGGPNTGSSSGGAHQGPTSAVNIPRGVSYSSNYQGSHTSRGALEPFPTTLPLPPSSSYLSSAGTPGAAVPAPGSGCCSSSYSTPLSGSSPGERRLPHLFNFVADSSQKGAEESSRALVRHQQSSGQHQSSSPLQRQSSGHHHSSSPLHRQSSGLYQSSSHHQSSPPLHHQSSSAERYQSAPNALPTSRPWSPLRPSSQLRDDGQQFGNVVLGAATAAREGGLCDPNHTQGFGDAHNTHSHNLARTRNSHSLDLARARNTHSHDLARARNTHSHDLARMCNMQQGPDIAGVIRCSAASDGVRSAPTSRSSHSTHLTEYLSSFTAPRVFCRHTPPGSSCHPSVGGGGARSTFSGEWRAARRQVGGLAVAGCSSSMMNGCFEGRQW